MAEYEIVEIEPKKPPFGCCNMVIWDAIFIIGFFVFAILDVFPIFEKVHIVFRILIGIAVLVLIQWLYTIKIIGIITHILAGFFYYYVIWNEFGDWIYKNVGDDKVTYWTIRILLGIVFIGMHLVSYGHEHLIRKNEDDG